MADSGAIRAGKAFVEIGGDNNPLVKALRASEGLVKSWGSKLSAIGGGLRSTGLRLMGAATAMLAPLALGVRSATKLGIELVDMSARTGISIEALQELGYAAKMSGLSLETLELPIRRMQKFLSDAAKGGKEAREELARLGVSLAQLQGLAPDRQLMALADAFGKISDPAARTGAAIKVFGRAGTEILPLLAEGAAGIERLRARARELGLVMSSEDARAAEQFGDETRTLWEVLKKAAVQVGSALIPALRDLTGNLIQGASQLVAWIKNNRELVVLVAKLAAGLFAAGLAMRLLGSAIGVLAPIVSLVGTGLGVIASGLALLLTPIGLVVAGLAALAAYFAWSTGVAGKAIQWLGGVLGTLQEDAALAFAGIRDALAAGDIRLAAQVLWAAIKLEWGRLVNWMSGMWESFSNFFLEVWDIAIHGLTVAAVNVWAAIVKAWYRSVEFIIIGWEKVKTALAEGWDWWDKSVQKVYAQRMVDLGAWSQAEADAYKTGLDRQKMIAQRRREEQATANIAAAGEKAAAEIGATDQRKAGVTGEATAGRNRRFAERDAARAGTDAAAEEDLTRKRKELEDLAGQAAQTRKDKEGMPAAEGPPGLGKGLDLGGLSAAKATSFGTFSPFAAATLGGGPIRQIAADIRQVKENTKFIREMRAFARWGP